MNLDEFRKVMQEKDRYESSGVQSWYRGLFLRRMDWWYYFRILALVVKARILRCFFKSKKKLLLNRAFKTFKLTEDSGASISIENFQNLRSLNRPTVFVANHMSLLETFILPTLLIYEFQDVSPVVKASLTRYPFFGPVLTLMDPITVERKNPRQDLKTVLEKGQQALKEGRSVLIFPQATRSETFDPMLFNSLGVKLAFRNNAPVLPVALKTDFYGIGRKFRDFGPLRRDRKVHFRFGEAMEVKNEKETQKNVVDFILKSLQEWETA